jgi:hypothetical protein
MSERRNAPIQMPHYGRVPHGIRFRVPWRIHKKAWQEYAKHYSGQSAERLADRGGFGLEELIYLLAGEDPSSCLNDDKMATDFFNKFDNRKGKDEV